MQQFTAIAVFCCADSDEVTTAWQVRLRVSGKALYDERSAGPARVPVAS